MGLDAVELVMAFEEQFGIEIANEDAEKLVTPVMVIDYICTKIRMTDEKKCQSQRAFYILRRALVQKSGRKRSEITPTTKLREIFPRSNCTGQWLDLKKAVDARGWPKLTYPRWIERPFLVVAFGALWGGTYFGMEFEFGILNAILLGVTLSFLLCIGIGFSTKSFRHAIPSRLVTLANLVPYVESSNAIQWARDAVAKRVRKIVIEQLCITESIYREDATFVADLGLS